MNPASREQPRRQRLLYGAVPLDPWHATHPDTESSYYATSISKISTIADLQMHRAVEQGWVNVPEAASEIHKLVTTSLLDAHTRRVMHNGGASLSTVSASDDTESEILSYAKDGLATPGELYRLLETNPTLKSIELAKLSHPFDFDASSEMQQVISTLVDEHAQTTFDFPRYKYKRYDSGVPAAIVVRKSTLGVVQLEAGYIEIIERKSLLVRGDTEACSEYPYIDRLIKNSNRRDELALIIEDQLSKMTTESGMCKWLQPTTTSYYAKYIELTPVDDANVLKANESQPELFEYPA